MEVTGALQAIGGLGLFLFGMVILTEGLRSLVGKTLRTALCKFTRSPTTGAITGGVATAILQSSSATTVAAVGFVASGLLTFPQALGIILGANIGTTITGWLVALLGFKFNVGVAALPVVLLGALLHMFAPGRWKFAGYAIGGLALIFVGIASLQTGMESFSDVVTPQSFPGNTLVGRAQLVAFGIAITVITQSSSAGVATALTAVVTGTIDLPQAAAMVIGMNIGTTVTAVLATIGGSTAVKRTGYAHAVFNVVTGLGAFILLVPYVRIAEALTGGVEDPELFLVGFHTLFNTLGVLVVLPIAGPFARLIERLVPEGDDSPTSVLDEKLLHEPGLALAAVGATLRRIANAELNAVVATLGGNRVELKDLGPQLSQTRAYLARIASHSGDTHGAFTAALHIVDHLGRLHRRLCELDPSILADRLGEQARVLSETATVLARWLEDPSVMSPGSAAQSAAQSTVTEMHEYRQNLILAGDAGSPDTIIARLDTARLLTRMSHHLWRLAVYLPELSGPSAIESGAAPTPEPGPSGIADDNDPEHLKPT